jgi:hypothetical protein
VNGSGLKWRGGGPPGGPKKPWSSISLGTGTIIRSGSLAGESSLSGERRRSRSRGGPLKADSCILRTLHLCNEAVAY